MEPSFSYSDSLKAYLKSFDFMPPELNEYELDLESPHLKDIKDKLPNVVSLRIKVRERDSYDLSDARIFYLKSLRVLTLYDVEFSEDQFEQFMKTLPPQLTRVCVNNHRTEMTVKVLSKLIWLVHDGLEVLDLSCDVPCGSIWTLSHLFLFQRAEDNDQFSKLLDITRLKRLQTLNLDGLGLPF